MIVIEQVVGNTNSPAPFKFTLEYAQSYILQGENRRLLKDYSIFRMQTLGARLSDLVIEGYWTMDNGIEEYKRFQEFLRQAKDGPYKLQQFIIGIEEPNGIGVAKSLSPEIRLRGLIQSYTISAQVSQPQHLSYQIPFKVYPYNDTSKRIKDIYWLN